MADITTAAVSAWQAARRELVVGSTSSWGTDPEPIRDRVRSGRPRTYNPCVVAAVGRSGTSERAICAHGGSLGRGVQSLRRYPVKSMLGEELDHASLGQRGVVGDRAYALIDDETQKVVSVKRPKRWGRMFELAAVTRGDTVEVRFPDGTSMLIGDAALPSRLSEFLGRAVSVASTPPPDATFDEVWIRELKNDIDPYLGMPSRVEDGEEMIDGGQFMSGNFSNGGAIHVVTTSSTRRLGELAPESRFDPLSVPPEHRRRN